MDLCILSASRNHDIIWHAFLNWDWPSKDCILPMRGLFFSSRSSFPSTWYSGQTALAFTFDDKSLHQISSNEWHDNISNTYKNILFSSYGSRKEKINVEEGGGKIHIKEQESTAAVRGELNAKQTHKVNL